MGVPLILPPSLELSVLMRSPIEGSPIKVHCSDPTWSTWISLVKLLYSLQCMNILFIDLGMFFISITLPADQVLELPSEHPTIENGFYFILFIPIIIY